ncbi:suppressor of fused domain protein [Polymorphospora rubra]|uniref:suppressor of fused domain protein n=1 Tax=Polymorphospora rubra TaxID=338584 RepID=UPI0033D2F0F4
MTEPTSPGWDAIDAALDRRYPGVRPLHHASGLPYAAGGRDPLDGISLYPRDDHWHLVSYGMSDLHEDRSPDKDESGWGFEFTIRVARAAGDDEPPTWALSFMQNLARNVYAREAPFVPGSHLQVNGPISTARPDTAIRAVAFAEDPELGTIDTPHGTVQFLQIVGLTPQEYAVIDRWDARRLLDALRPPLPLLVTDLDRTDLTADPTVAAVIEEGVRRDGSSRALIPAKKANWRIGDGVTTVILDVAAAEHAGRLLPLRLPYGRDLTVNPFDKGVKFGPGEEFTAAPGRFDLLEIRLPADAATEVATVLRSGAGTYRPTGTPGLQFRVAPATRRFTFPPPA